MVKRGPIAPGAWLTALHEGRFSLALAAGLPSWANLLIKAHRIETMAGLADACRAVSVLLRDLP